MCPICLSSDAFKTERQAYFSIDCPRCGSYRVAINAIPPNGVFEIENTRDRANASSYMYHNWPADRVVTVGDVEWLREVHAPTVAVRRDLLLRNLARRLGGIGKRLNLQGEIPELLAVSWSSDMQEVSALLSHLAEVGYLEPSRGNLNRSKITARGWDAIASTGASSADRSKIFVAMSFRDDMAECYENGIKLAIRRAGYNEDRVDRREHNKVVYDEILASIRSSHAVVADLTHQSQGTYFEVGFARALGKEVFLTCKEDQIDPQGSSATPMTRVHFDQRHFNILPWATPEVLAYKLRIRIEAILGKGPIHHEGLPPEVRPTE